MWEKSCYIDGAQFIISDDSDSEAQVRGGIDFSRGREEGQSQVMMFLLSRVTMTGGCTPQDFQVWVNIIFLSNAFRERERKEKKYIWATFRGKQAW